MQLNLTDKTVLISGGSKGIGFAVATAFAEEGAHVHLVSRSSDDLAAAAESLRRRYQVDVQFSALDLSDSSNINHLLDACPNPDILVNNAGAIPAGNLQAVDEETWRAAWDLKVFGYINMTRAYMAMMLARGQGVIVNVVGLAGVRMDAGYVCGSTGNASLDAFTRAVGSNSIDQGVRVLGVHPGAVQTDRIINLMRTRAAADGKNPDDWADYLSNLPLSRAIEPQEVADLVLFLASERASYLSGIMIPMDGGMSNRASAF
ncbi:MAG: short-chain dehydrogenase [Nisaea sp.]|jgi:NAD(P)-dependent dehydrogenase (short-subunit alcohol dehydrogenase family)|nr:short-chain dehydrogenase [Nisaea sp.]OUX97862.1 MAG: short-chain dehydrogenase [Candidatus Endolissoclinum sp. TMED26]